MNQTPPKLIYFIVFSIAILAGMGMFSLCLAMFQKTWAPDGILTAVITLTGGAFGALGGILSSPRSAVNSTTSTTNSAGVTTTTTQPVLLAPIATAPVTVVSPPSDPANVKETTPDPSIHNLTS